MVLGWSRRDTIIIVLPDDCIRFILTRILVGSIAVSPPALLLPIFIDFKSNAAAAALPVAVLALLFRLKLLVFFFVVRWA